MIDTLVKGTVYLHQFTVPEGLTVAEVACQVGGAGVREGGGIRAAAEESVDLVRDFEGEARGLLEGYLFPETYFFAGPTTPRRAIEAMVGRFRAVLAQLETRIPSETWPLNLRDTMVLASLVEAEAARE